MNDGAAALVLASEDWARDRGLAPLAVIRSAGYVADDYAYLVRTPAAATKVALEKAGMAVSDIDLLEVNEAFCSVALNTVDLLGIDPERVNVNGGAVALGHPIGASGARLLGTLDARAAPPRRRDRRRGDLLGRRPGRRNGARGARRVSDRICVVGAGQMGSGIAQVAAVAGYDVTLVDVSRDQLDRARGGIERSLAKLVEKGNGHGRRRRGGRRPDRAGGRAGAGRPRHRGRHRGRRAQGAHLPRPRRGRRAGRRARDATRARSRSPGWPRSPRAPTGSSACTS